MSRVGIIGYGKMGSAFLKGVKKSNCNDYEFYCTAGNFDSLKERLGGMATALESNSELVKKSDIIILSVKPAMVSSVLSELLKENPNCFENKIIFCFAVGLTFDKLEEYAVIRESNAHHISGIPNLPVEIGEGIIMAEKSHNLTADELLQIEKLFKPLGKLIYLDSKQMAVGSAVAGSSPATVALLVEALSDAAVKSGIFREDAEKIAIQMIKGTSALMEEQMNNGTFKGPARFKDAVCSPGGTTIRGIASLEEYGFRNSVIKSIDSMLF